MLMEEKLINGLLDGIKEFQNNPFRYFYESDIKCLLYGKFYEHYKKDIELNVRKEFFGKDKIYIGKVATEYYYFIKGTQEKSVPGNNKMDIAILNDEKMHTLTYINNQLDSLFTSESNWIQPVKYGIEIKFHQVITILI